MKILINKKGDISQNSVCCIGSFDGVHRGHQAIIEHAKKLAGHDKKVGIITFIPLPFFVLKSAPVIYLSLEEEKEKIIKELGANFIYYFKFTKKFSQLGSDDFIKLIVARISPSAVVVGENFHFGRDRKGTAKILKQYAKDRFSVHILPCVKDEGTISSTRIRELLLLGHIKAANKLLGREYTISGTVIKGKGKGTKIGFPTINIKVRKEKLMPLDGVYKVRVFIRNKKFIGAMFCCNGLVEVHILRCSGSFYKSKLTIKLLERIRGVERFPDDEALRAAIAKDVEAIRHSLP